MIFMIAAMIVLSAVGVWMSVLDLRHDFRYNMQMAIAGSASAIIWLSVNVNTVALWRQGKAINTEAKKILAKIGG